MRFDIVYKRPTNEMFEEKIREVLENVGVKFCGSGAELPTNERVICFDIDEMNLDTD